MKTLPTDMQPEDFDFLRNCPKAVLFAMAKHLAAAMSESYEDSLSTGEYRVRMREEWIALNANGIVLQKPGKVTP